MLSAGGHGLRSALLPAFKEGGRRVASDSGNGAPAYYGYGSAAWRLSPTQPDPTRALNALRTALLEGGDLRNLWAAAKARARAVLSTTAVSADSAGSSCHAAAARARRSGAIPAASLAPLYGSDGPLRWLIMYALAHGSRAFMTRANNTSVQGAEHMAAALARPAGTPLITVCNHVASMDDPLVMSTILPPQLYAQPGDLRWTLCASDRCFHRSLLVPFFRAAKVLPVERGAGMFQPGLAAAEERLRAGDWVHIFPEGTRTRDGRLQPVRKGVGRLVAACGHAAPLVVPFVHSGMQDVLPKGSLMPRCGRDVRVLVGEPIDVSDLLAAAETRRWGDDELYAAVATRIGGALAVLQARLDGLPADAAADAAAAASAAQAVALEAGLDLYDPVDNAHRAASLWERARFRMAHREWASAGLASARARLAAAAATLSRAASGGALQGADDDAVGVLGEGLLAPASRWFEGHSSSMEQTASGTSVEDYYSRQRSVAMMQLLQARV